MAILHGQKLGAALCDAFGLDKHLVRSLTFHCDVSEAATVLVEQFVTDEQGRRTADVIVREYEVTPKDPDGDR